jgi:hypothetical protein
MSAQVVCGIVNDSKVYSMNKERRERAQISVTLDCELRAAIERAAEVEHRSVSNQVRHWIAQAVAGQREGIAA